MIDTSETYEMAREVKQVFEEQFGLGTSTKPIKAIILTHFHPDHTFGFDVFKVKQNRLINMFQTLKMSVKLMWIYIFLTTRCL